MHVTEIGILLGSGNMDNLKIPSFFTYKDEVSRTISWGHWFLFLNIFLAVAIGLSYLYNTPTPSTGLGIVYLVISWLGHFSCLVTIIYILIFFPLSFIGNLKIYRVLAVILTVLLFMIMLVDVKLYQAIKIHINLSVLDLFFEQEGFSTGLNFNFLYIAAPVLLAIECLFSSLAWRHIYTRSHQKLSFFVSSVFLISFFSAHIMHIWADAYKYVPITQQKSIFPAYYPMTANTFLKEHGWIVDIHEGSHNEIERKNIDRYQQKIRYPLENLRVTPNEAPLNIVMVLIEGLSKEYLNIEYMPRLVDFAARHDSYENHYLGSNDATLTTFEIFYGLPGQYLPLIRSSETPPVSMTEMLQQDYKFQSFMTGKPSKKVTDFRAISGIRRNQLKSFSSDEETVKSAVQYIRKWDSSRPQMVIVSLNGPLTLKDSRIALRKFQPEIPYSQLISENVENGDPQVFNRYYNTLLSTDILIDEIQEALLEDGKLKNTVFIITSIRGMTLPFPSYQETKYDRRTFHVPLIISWPDAIIPAKITALTSSQDLAPTISREILGIRNDYDTYSTGMNVRDLDNRPWILSGDSSEIRIIASTQTTAFDKHGNASIYSDDPEHKSQPNMSTLIKAIKILNKFKDK